MIDENAFHAALDADPGNHLTRLVFADWLDERGDPRAAGYRVLGRLGRVPYSPFKNVDWMWADYTIPDLDADDVPDLSELPKPWFVAALRESSVGRPFNTPNGSFFFRDTRRIAEDVAALAWSKLDPAEQDRILAAHLETAK